MDNPCTSDFALFGYREKHMFKEILEHWLDKEGLPQTFTEDQVQVMFNMNSGNVFLTNEDYETVMLNPDTDKLEMFYNSPYNGLEGFFDDLLEEYPTMHEEDKEWFKAIAEHVDRLEELPIDSEGPEENEQAT